MKVKLPGLGIGVIGGGNMATAIIAGLLRQGHRPARLHIAEPRPEQRARLAALHPSLVVTADNAAVAGQAEVLLIAVKPQVLEAVVTNLGSRPPGQLVVSVAAGVTLQRLGGWLGTATPVIRAMPNQPALVGAGMSALVAGPGVSRQQREQAIYVLSAVGEARWVDDESLIDAVTAVSGSGPAYFYLLMEILEDCAVELGLPADLARRLVVQTAYGAGLSARDTGTPPPDLRASVTSPGGTTAAAIAALEQAGLRDMVRNALRAAHQRSLELGRD